MRPNTTSTEGQVPNTGGISDCPDIIPVQQATVDPQGTYSGAGSWGTTYPNQVVEGAPNYIYVRGKNWASGQETATVSLYAVGNALIPWPDQWLSNPLTVQATGGTTVTLEAQTNQQIVVGTQPFYWQAPPPPAGSDHYCLFALVDTPSNPNPLLHSDVPMTYTTMADLVTNTLYVGWKNVAEVSNNTPTWVKQMTMNVPKGASANQLLHVYVFGTQGTIGGQVAVSSGDSVGFNPPINISQTTIASSTDTYGTLTTPIPGQASTVLNVQFWQGNSNPQFGDRIIAVCGWVPATMEEAQPYIDRGMTRPLPQDRMVGDVGVEVAIGAMHYEFTAAASQ
jgi:hypothetical protein